MSSFMSDAATADIYTLSLHDALPISRVRLAARRGYRDPAHRPGHGAWHVASGIWSCRSEEHTSELQSLTNLVCRLLLGRKKVPPSTLPTECSPCHILPSC